MDIRASSTSGSLEPASKKRRGRPLRPLEGSPEEENKRARARESQKAFQRRRQGVFNKLEKRVAILQDTIEDMNKEFLQLGERIIQNAETSGDQLMLNEVKRTTERFLKLAKQTEYEESSGVEGQYNSTTKFSVTQTSPGVPGLLPPVATPFRYNALFTAGIPDFNLATNAASANSFQPDIYTTMNDASWNSTPSGLFTPRLNYGLLPLKELSSWDNPWLSYLIAGPYSFATNLYIATTSLTFYSLRGELSVPGFVASTLRYRFRYETPDQLLPLLNGILSKLLQIRKQNLSSTIVHDFPKFMTLGARHVRAELVDLLEDQSTEKDEYGIALLKPTDYEPMNTMLNNLLLKIVHDVTRETGSLENWLDPWGVQEYITKTWGLILERESVLITPKTLDTLAMHNQYNISSTTTQSYSSDNPTVQEQGQYLSLSQRAKYVVSVAPTAPESHPLLHVPYLDPLSWSPHQQSQGDVQCYPEEYMTSPNQVSRSRPQQEAQPSQISSSHFQSPTITLQNRTQFSDSVTTISSSSTNTIPLSIVPLYASLRLEGVCFGDGPRYSRTGIDKVLYIFLNSWRSNEN